MYAVIKQGGHQYKIAPGDVIQIEKVVAEKGEELLLENVLLIKNGEKLELGEPRVTGATVKAKVLRQDRSPKVDVYKFRRRKGSDRRSGHRQPFTEIQITAITKNGAVLGE